MITEIESKRAVFSIYGECEDVNESEFFLVNRETGRQFEPTYKEYANNRYKILLNVESMNDEMPLMSGKYYLVRKNDLVEEKFQGSTNANIRIRKSNKEYIICDVTKDSDGSLCINVDTKLPGKRDISIKKRIVEFGFNSIFQAINFIIPKCGNKIFITSGSRAYIDGNEKFIYDEMLKRGWDRKYKIVQDFKASISIRYNMIKMLKFIYNMATSDVIIVDDYYPEINKVNYSKKTSIFQVWHACGAFKTVGLERGAKKGAPPINSKVHKCYTHVPVSSKLSAFHQQEAYGIDFDKFYTVGIPRTDVFFDDEYKKHICEEIFKEYPQIRKFSRVILYAPTFRGDSSLDAFFPMDKIDMHKLGLMCAKTNSFLIIKMHPFVKEKVDIPVEYQDYMLDASNYREVNDWLFVSDILITDYSSVIYEFSLLKKPMLFYAFDQAEYVEQRDFYESYEETVPGEICQTLDELIEHLYQDNIPMDKIESFIQKNFEYMDGKATERVVDLIADCLKE